MTNMITLHDEISGYADEACLLDGEYLVKQPEPVFFNRLKTETAEVLWKTIPGDY